MGIEKYYKLIGVIGFLIGLFIIDPLLGNPFYQALVYLFGEPSGASRIIVGVLCSLLIIFLIGRVLYKRYKSSQ